MLKYIEVYMYICLDGQTDDKQLYPATIMGV